MSQDMAIELKPYGVSVVSLWPGVTRTELSKLFNIDNLVAATGMTKVCVIRIDESFEQPSCYKLRMKFFLFNTGKR